MTTAAKPGRVVIDHFSLDPPGSNTPIGFPYAPLKRRPTLDDVRRTCQSAPLDTLPRALIPRSHASLRPPVLRFGWVADDEKLLELAEKYDCIITKAPYDPKDFEDEDEDEDKDEDDDPRWPGVDILDTMNDVIVQVANDLGIELPSLQIGGAMRAVQLSISVLLSGYVVLCCRKVGISSRVVGRSTFIANHEVDMCSAPVIAPRAAHAFALGL
ncbi:predicted protein [Postia placenta Mad-698-R]|nr:predicted protein [Postia placenta Mad-698-R]